MAAVLARCSYIIKQHSADIIRNSLVADERPRRARSPTTEPASRRRRKSAGDKRWRGGSAAATGGGGRLARDGMPTKETRSCLGRLSTAADDVRRRLGVRFARRAALTRRRDATLLAPPRPALRPDTSDSLYSSDRVGRRGAMIGFRQTTRPTGGRGACERALTLDEGWVWSVNVGESSGGEVQIGVVCLYAVGLRALCRKRLHFELRCKLIRRSGLRCPVSRRLQASGRMSDDASRCVAVSAVSLRPCFSVTC